MTISGKEFINNFRNERLNPFSQLSSPSLITRGDMQKNRRLDSSTQFVNNMRNSIQEKQNLQIIPRAPAFVYKTPTVVEEKKPTITEVKISKSPRYNFKAISETNLKDLENRQSRDFNNNMPNSRYYNYIPFSFEDEVGTQYGLIQTPSFAKNEITGVFLDNGFSWGPEDAMKFISSAKDNIFIPSESSQRSYFNGYGDARTAPTNWLQDMRRYYLKNNPRSVYKDMVVDSIERYERDGKL